MSLPALPAGDLLARLAEAPGGLTVVTPNRRLAAALASAHDRGQREAGHEAWPTPDIIPWGGLVERLWDAIAHAPGEGDLPLVLAPAEEEALWEAVVAESRHAADLAGPAGAARAARDAWALQHAHRLGPALARAEAHEDALAYREWSARFERRTRERGLTDGARLPDEVIARRAALGIARPDTIVLHAFDRITPQQAALVRALAEDGSRVFSSDAPLVESTPRRVAWPSPRDELAAAAAWARARLEAGLAGGRVPRIGIVVPDLAQRRASVERALSRALHPESVVTPPANGAFEISLGLPLAERPVVHDALGLIALLGQSVPWESASRLIRSPHLGDADREHASRARLDAALRERAPATLTLDRLQALASMEGLPAAPSLAARLERLAVFRRERLFGPRAASDWAKAFAEALAIAGWPGERAPDSAAFQAIGKWHETLAAFARLERVTGRFGFREAHSRLARLASATLFQPETPEVPVVAMGILESAGLAFDHLWVAGLTDEAWPLATRPNPFLPLAVQRAAGIPEADPATALELDRRITRGWLAAAPEVVLSHALADGEAVLAPSPLVADFVRDEFPGLAPVPAWRDAIARAPMLEDFTDDRGPPLAEGTGRGGTAIFRDQAACPFRAFAAHRLAARPLAAPAPGLDAADRGTLLHQALALAWSAIGSKGRLDDLDEAQLAAILADAARESVARFTRTHPHALGERGVALERERLARLSAEWIGKERERPDFEVLAVEREVAASFGGVAVRAKIDRLDRLAAGGLAILDYKTGAAAVSSWLGARPGDPQLPLYALALGDEVAAIAFARVRPGDCAFEGLAAAEGLLPRVKTVSKNRSPNARAYADWPALVAAWHAQFESLGRDFAAGVATVDPKDGARTCERCDQFLACRVAERGLEPAGDETEDDDD